MNEYLLSPFREILFIGNSEFRVYIYIISIIGILKLIVIHTKRQHRMASVDGLGALMSVDPVPVGKFVTIRIVLVA